MAFESEEQVNLIPTTIRYVKVELFDGIGDHESSWGDKHARFEVRVDDQFDRVLTWRRGDLTNHLTQGQIDQLIAFMDMLRTKAESEILP